MSLFEAIRVAVDGLRANRLRSGLTVLGILIGVGAVVLLVAVGNGASRAVENQIESLGSNLLIVFPGPVQAGGVQQGFGSGASLTMQDAQALKDPQALPEVRSAVPVVNSRAQLAHGSQNWNTSLTGTTEDFPGVRNYQVASGQFFTSGDVRGEARVAVLGQTVVENLFGTEDPIGQSIKINRQGFRVVGVFQPKGAAGVTNQDDLVAVPITAAWAYLLGGRNRNVQQIYVEAQSAGTMTEAQAEVTQTLLDRHHIRDAGQADFRVLNQADILSTASQVTGTLTVLLGAIAAISLVVGGIGIMNIMLVTVTERTKEIGIRKAIGARRRDVLQQFLIESMVLSGAGGLLGIGTGMTAASLLPRLLSSLQPVVSIPSVLLAFAVSMAIGLFFGIYPANRAARLNPIEALRYE